VCAPGCVRATAPLALPFLCIGCPVLEEASFARTFCHMHNSVPSEEHLVSSPGGLLAVCGQ
jgi:hypothetical protein